jgi:hypothetical protein
MGEAGVRGGRSFAQSKNGLMTTDLGMYGALSASLNELSGAAKR